MRCTDEFKNINDVGFCSSDAFYNFYVYETIAKTLQVTLINMIPN